METELPSQYEITLCFQGQLPQISFQAKQGDEGFP